MVSISQLIGLEECHYLLSLHDNNRRDLVSGGKLSFYSFHLVAAVLENNCFQKIISLFSNLSAVAGYTPRRSTTILRPRSVRDGGEGRGGGVGQHLGRGERALQARQRGGEVGAR